MVLGGAEGLMHGDDSMKELDMNVFMVLRRRRR